MLEHSEQADCGNDIVMIMTIEVRTGMPESRTKEDRPRPEASALPRTFRPRSQSAPTLLCVRYSKTLASSALCIVIKRRLCSFYRGRLKSPARIFFAQRSASLSPPLAEIRARSASRCPVRKNTNFSLQIVFSAGATQEEHFTRVFTAVTIRIHMDKKMENINYQDWYASAYAELTGFGVWLKGGEMNALPKEEYAKRPFRILFTRLSTYVDVADSFTHSFLYQIAAGLPGIYPDIAYLPPEADARIFDRDSVPWLLGTTTKIGPRGFDVIGFSNSIVQELINIPILLRKSGIPLVKTDRIKDDSIPILLLGGANAIHATALWGKEPLVDGIFIGDDPQYIGKLFDISGRMKKEGAGKRDILEAWEDVPGFIQPDIPRKTKKGIMPGTKGAVIFDKGIIPYGEENIGSSHLMISDGCRGLCSFCSENWNKKPYRESGLGTLLDKALELKSEMGLEKINLYSFNFNMYSHFYELVWKLLPCFDQIGLKSQRFDMLAVDPEMINYETAFGKTSFSCGLEGISGRVRRYLNKNLDDDLLAKSCDLVFRAHARELKMFLICTGYEEESDMDEFGEFLGALKKMREYSGNRTRVIFSITPLVRFPWTPLEFDKAFGADEYAQIIKKIKRAVSDSGFEAREAMPVKEYMVSQVLVRADNEKVKDAMITAALESDFVYYRNISDEFYEIFFKVLKQGGINTSDMFRAMSLEEANVKPWVFCETGTDRKKLWDIFRKNISFNEVGGSLAVLSKERPVAIEELRKRVASIRKNRGRFTFLVSVSTENRALVRKYFGTVLARAIMRSEERLIPLFRTYVSSYWAACGKEPVWITGADLITLEWDTKAKDMIPELCAKKTFIEKVNKELGKWGELKCLARDKDPYVFKIMFNSPLVLKLQEYLKQNGMKYTLYKLGEGNYSYKFTKETVKKKIIAELYAETVTRQDAGGAVKEHCVTVIPSEKFCADDFTQGAFVFSDKNDRAKVTITADLVI